MIDINAVNYLTIAQRDPIDREDLYTPFWLNKKTSELFQFIEGNWVSLTQVYINNLQLMNKDKEALEYLSMRLLQIPERIFDNGKIVEVYINETGKREWVAISDHLPSCDGLYEVCYEATELSSRECSREWFLDGKWVQKPFSFHLDIIYWMPLPEPPRE